MVSAFVILLPTNKYITLLNVWGSLNCVFSGKRKCPTSQSTDYLHASWHEVHWQMTLSIKCLFLDFFHMDKVNSFVVLDVVVCFLLVFPPDYFDFSWFSKSSFPVSQ